MKTGDRSAVISGGTRDLITLENGIESGYTGALIDTDGSAFCYSGVIDKLAII